MWNIILTLFRLLTFFYIFCFLKIVRLGIYLKYGQILGKYRPQYTYSRYAYTKRYVNDTNMEEFSLY